MASVRVLRRVRERGFSLALPNILRSTHPIEACHTALPIANTTTVELGDRIRAAALRQQEESESNYFTRVEDMRDFVIVHAPSPGVEITVKMVCFSGERLTANNGTRVTLSDYLCMSISKDLFELNAINRKPFIMQITVWDAKKQVGFPRSTPWRSAQGRYTSSSKYTLWGFTLRSLSGASRWKKACRPCRPEGSASPEAKGERTPSDRKGKARALAMFDAEEEKDEEPNADAAVVALRTRGTAVSRA
ncbi:hypothetical protein GQ600_5742 [Phytophthora cactorum]|nr:hypothetical protein GQ600_5742 [Phytophthora cactorum]